MYEAVSSATVQGVTGLASVALGVLYVVSWLSRQARRDRETESRILGRELSAGETKEASEGLPNVHEWNPQGPPLTPSKQAEQAEFGRLWEEAQARLAMYHQLAVIQGRQSFRMLLLFSSLGFGLLAFVVWKGTEVHTTAGGLALGAAGVAGAALSAYVGRTFMPRVSRRERTACRLLR
jgi:hypothetical protein